MYTKILLTILMIGSIWVSSSYASEGTILSPEVANKMAQPLFPMLHELSA